MLEKNERERDVEDKQIREKQNKERVRNGEIERYINGIWSDSEG